VSKRHQGILVLLVALVGACSADGDDNPASPEPPTTTEATEVAVSLPAAACCTGVPIDAGPYLLPERFAPLTTIELPDGWTIVNEAAARYLAFGRGSNDIGTPSQLVMLLAGPAADHADLADDIASSPELEILADSTTTESGIESRQLDAIARPNPDFIGAPAADIAPGTQRLTALGPLVSSNFGLVTSTPEARLRFVLRREGELLLVAVIEAPAADFDAFAAAADELLAGLAS
jgi:hypothetical protein